MKSVAKKKRAVGKYTTVRRDQRFFSDIAAILRSGRATAYRTVNSVMILTYWRIGRRIVEQEQKGKRRADYGDSLMTHLSRYLGDTFGKGFSEANLFNFRHFYLTYPDFNQFSTHCVENLSWTHIRLIMRLADERERSYYFKEVGDQNWSSRVLERNIRSGYYRRIRSTRRKGTTEILPPSEETLVPEDFIKDPYVLEFLDVPEDISGKETMLETAVIGHLRRFLLELGKGFSFVGRQFRVSTESSHFYIDLVFYNYILKCFVIVDLKTARLTHQDIGQMDMYVRMFDEVKRGADDNPTIGLILCADKDETVVKYSVLKENRRIFASKYSLVLPSEDELASGLRRDTLFLREAGELYDARSRDCRYD